MRYRRLHSPPAMEGVNVTPMIDVVMCLIIFFLIVGKLAHDQTTNLRLPQTAIGQEGAAHAGIVVTIVPANEGESEAVRWGQSASATGLFARVAVQQQPVGNATELKNALERALGGAPASTALVQVRADRGVPFGLVEPTLNACRALGITSVTLATERAP